MKVLSSAVLLTLIHNSWAHGGHGSDERVKGETIQQYAERHMASEHHIDSFDLQSFFKLHDLNSDGYWDRAEIEAIYGVHHIYSQKKSKDDIEHQKKADHIANTVLGLLDKDKDGKVSPEEFASVGLAGLPNFDDLGAEGHHYDIESEFFLHHEEEFHSTPETQTDESYTHPEDLEHFAHHEAIERKEAEKEAEFEGISVEEVIHAHEHAADAPPPADPESFGDGSQVPIHPHADDVAPEAAPPSHVLPPNPKVTRVTPPEKQDPKVKYSGVKDSKAAWGSGDEGYKSPKEPADKMRKNLPYKYKFRRAWGDF